MQLSADAPSPDWYSTHAAPFCARTFAIDMEPARQRFLRHVRAGGRILDVGCGSGRDSVRFHELGHEVDARDRSPTIAEEARRRTGLAARVEDVLEMQDDAAFDGIWASAMLIHLDEHEFHEAVRRLVRALRPGGALHISLKHDEFASAGDARVPVLDDGRGARGDLRQADAARARRGVGAGGEGGEGDQVRECGGEAERQSTDSDFWRIAMSGPTGRAPWNFPLEPLCSGCARVDGDPDGEDSETVPC